MEKPGIKEKQLLPSRTMFHGIILGFSCSPIGNIKIDVLFGDKLHFRREPIWFEVVHLDSPYHALSGRLALAKFMAVPHYAYLKMKMSAVGWPESLVIAEEKRLLDRAMAMAREQPAIPSDPKDAEAQGSFQPAKETKKIALDPVHPERFAVVGSNLDSK
nr:uncharacterized protein LOC120967067 [Aegilops tauschii subsp. strangulata]